MNFRPSKHDRPVFGKLASEYSLTYYGTVVPSESDDYLPIRGITASPEQVDDNYTTGVISGYEVHLLQRTHDIYTKAGDRLERTWTICHTGLVRHTMPHLLICSKSKRISDDQTLASYLRMYEIDLASFGSPIADDFADKFAIFLTPKDIPVASRLLTPEFQAMLSINFSNYDFELDGQDIYIYGYDQPLELVKLDRQLRGLVWLAETIRQTKLT